jgi:hypothetical protein
MTNITERTRVEESKPATDAQTRELRSFLSTFIAWTAIAAGLVAAALLVLLTMTSDPAPQPREVHHPAPESSLLGMPRSADAAERWLANRTPVPPVGAPHSADAAERWLANSTPVPPVGAPHSADAAERWLAHSTLARPVGVPGSADAAERYLADNK